MEIEEIHNKVLEFLGKQIREDNSDLVFRVRKTNRGNKLSKGYWFLGNDEYLAIGFWPEMNWKTKLPNISLNIEKDGATYLLINTSDSEEKERYVENFLDKKIDGLNKNAPNIWGKMYEGKNYLQCLSDFLNYDWYKIDNEIKQDYLENKQPPFSIIDEYEFQNDINKILVYRNERKEILQKARDWNESVKNVKPCKIKNFRILNYGPIVSCESGDIPDTTQWIFLTGENGTGKTSILKALTTALGYKKNEKRDSDKEAFRVNFDLLGEYNQVISVERFENMNITARMPLSIGLAAYGAYRINNIQKKTKNEDLKKASLFRSLFYNDGKFLNLIDEINRRDSNKGLKDLTLRKDEFLEFLEKAMINDGRVRLIENKKNGSLQFSFEEADNRGNLHPPVEIDKLSSGYLSIILMMNDMLIRLLKQQPKVKDIADLRGIVLIDEIDLHLHPKYQKHLVEQLSEAFPNIQFIATTHSPIPLLGAPEATVFLKVYREKENGVTLNRLKKLENEIDYLLPNTILTSDIFDFDLLEDIPKKQLSKIYSEDHYEDIRRNKEIDKKLRSLDKSIFPDDLFKDE